jgi:hypothetical protein
MEPMRLLERSALAGYYPRRPSVKRARRLGGRIELEMGLMDRGRCERT